MKQKRSIGEYLAFLAVKNDVPPEEFLNALRTVEENKSIQVEKLTVQLRIKLKNKSIFLVKKNSDVIAQFPVNNSFLLDKSNRLMNFMKTNSIRKYLAKKNRTTPSNNIADLRPGMTKVNLKAEVLEIAEPKRIVTRYGNNANIVKVLIGDQTGTIKLCLWNEQIDNVSKGDIIQIENAQASAFRGERQLALGKRGKLTTINKLV